MRILVFGATGNVGGHFTRLAREKGHHVTAVARRDREGMVLGDVPTNASWTRSPSATTAS